MENKHHIYRFRAYKSEAHHDLDKYYFEKFFTDHTEMKVFSAKHSLAEGVKYPDYKSMYIRITDNPVAMEAVNDFIEKWKDENFYLDSVTFSD